MGGPFQSRPGILRIQLALPLSDWRKQCRFITDLHSELIALNCVPGFISDWCNEVGSFPPTHHPPAIWVVVGKC